MCVCACVWGGRQREIAWRRQFKGLRSGDKTNQAPQWKTGHDCFSPASFPSTCTQKHACINPTNQKWCTSPAEILHAQTGAQGTSGHWILTMKLQRLHSNGGDEVRSWDRNHKLIPLTWQAARPWLSPNATLCSSTEVRKTPREENTFLLILGQRKATTDTELTQYDGYFLVSLLYETTAV